ELLERDVRAAAGVDRLDLAAGPLGREVCDLRWEGGRVVGRAASPHGRAADDGEPEPALVADLGRAEAERVQPVAAEVVRHTLCVRDPAEEEIRVVLVVG